MKQKRHQMLTEVFRDTYFEAVTERGLSDYDAIRHAAKEVAYVSDKLLHHAPGRIHTRPATLEVLECAQ